MASPWHVLRIAIALTAAGLAGVGAAHAQPNAGPFLLQPTPEEQTIGAVDVCVRWGADPAHLADVLMTNSSGDKDLDAKIPDMVRSMPYPRPAGDDGAWFGLSLSFGAAEPHHALPDCDAAIKALTAGAEPI